MATELNPTAVEFTPDAVAFAPIAVEFTAEAFAPLPIAVEFTAEAFAPLPIATAVISPTCAWAPPYPAPDKLPPPNAIPV